jgi:hypothetical protein
MFSISIPKDFRLRKDERLRTAEIEEERFGA